MRRPFSITEGLQICWRCAVTTTACNKVALLGGSAYAATAAAVATRAALRLALVILEEEQIVGPRCNLGA